MGLLLLVGILLGVLIGQHQKERESILAGALAGKSISTVETRYTVCQRLLFGNVVQLTHPGLFSTADSDEIPRNMVLFLLSLEAR
jgi:hypothetical protein